ncbi:hypothetical protein OHA70_32750 [Kribbella sp. NBC_00382]|uniref:hypothetical protein n=1 Tax=Kribbella sp. NBC_00382 TaxID=2975967 RepID=UPI002E1BBB6C
MRIEDLLTEAADDTGRPLRHSVDDIVRRGRRTTRARQLATGATATLTTAVVIAGVATWQADRPDSIQPAATPGQTFKTDASTGKLIDPTTGKLIEPPPPVSPLADAEIIRRCGPDDKLWREHLPSAGDKAGPINGQWTVPLKTGRGDGFQAVILSPDRTIAVTCQLKDKSSGSGEGDYRRTTLASQPSLLPTVDAKSKSRKISMTWSRVPESVVRVVGRPVTGSPREALVTRGFATWGIEKDPGGLPVSGKVTGYDAGGKIVFEDTGGAVPVG